MLTVMKLVLRSTLHAWICQSPEPALWRPVTPLSSRDLTQHEAIVTITNHADLILILKSTTQMTVMELICPSPSSEPTSPEWGFSVMSLASTN